MISYKKVKHHIVQAAELVRTHMLTSVFVGLLISWLTSSYFVYHIEHEAQDANITSLGKALWWGVVTLLTVGYGDFTPVTVAGRICASALMFTGVIAIAIITSRISYLFLEQALREGRGIVNTDKLNNHFVVCGWKEEMHELLLHILDFNQGMKANEIVLIANISPTTSAALQDHPRLKGLNVVLGEYFQAVNLERAGVERAARVLILADRTPNTNGTIPTMTEVDARTVMTAMTLSNIARNTLVTAEILDSKMDQYLKIAQVSEIIYSREYSRLLVGNASGGTGIASIIYDLLDPRTPAIIRTYPIPEELHSQSFAKLKEYFDKAHPRDILIGVLENTGNTHRIKEMALREAQKTTDMQRLVENLRKVKNLQCNHPIFNPKDDFVVPDNAMAIVIETKNEIYGQAQGLST